MSRDRIICSGEKSCGCVRETKTEDHVINPSMRECARNIKGASATVYCCLTREKVHIIK
jgi:hypothetical protein